MSCSKSSSSPMMRSWRPVLMCTKRSKIAICSSPINNRRRILTCPHSRLRILKCNKAITLRSSGVFVSNNHSLKNLPKLLKIMPHGVSLCLPSQSPHKNLRQRSVHIVLPLPPSHHRKMPLLRHQIKTQRRRRRMEENLRKEKPKFRRRRENGC